MSLTQLLQTIQSLPLEQQRELLELYQLIDWLYQKYGAKLGEKQILDVVAQENKELAALIQSTQRSIGLTAAHKVVGELQRICKPNTLEITSNDGSAIKAAIQSKHQDASIHTHQDDILWLKVQSSKGQLYERTINKDIAKLTR